MTGALIESDKRWDSGALVKEGTRSFSIEFSSILGSELGSNCIRWSCPSRVINGEVNINAESEGDKPYPKSKPHDVFAFDMGPDYASDFEVDICKDDDQHKPQNVMDQELGVQERNWRNIFDVPEQRGQHYR